jgi:hypothetical protein
MNKTEVLIQLPTETSYWGSDATKADVSRICDNLESMIRAEFEARLELTFERTQTPRGGGVHSAHEDSAQEVWNWISENWTAAL